MQESYHIVLGMRLASMQYVYHNAGTLHASVEGLAWALHTGERLVFSIPRMGFAYRFKLTGMRIAYRAWHGTCVYKGPRCVI